jgi:hypothetical protein
VTDAYVCRLLPLTCLAPDIVEAILDGRQPKGLRLAEVVGNGPVAGKSSGTLGETPPRVTELKIGPFLPPRGIILSTGVSRAARTELSWVPDKLDGRGFDLWPSFDVDRHRTASTPIGQISL